MPVRLIMNNRTLTVFEGVEFNKLVHSYNIKDTILSKIIERKGCFSLESPSSVSSVISMSFCAFGMSASDEWVNEWDYDFNLFKNQCAVNQGEVDFSLDSTEEGKLNNELTQLKADIIKQKELQVANELEEQTIYKEKNAIDETELSAIEKEFDIEQMVQQEERQREEKMEEELNLQIEKEKEKRNCLLKNIREKARENQYNLLTDELRKEVDEKKKDATITITKRRNEMQELIIRMKEKADRRRKKLQQQLNLVRSEINEDAQTEAKKSDYNCSSNLKGEKVDNEIYCNSRFPSNPQKNGECRNANRKEQWCRFCCSNENGSLYLDQRNLCFKKCNNNGDDSKAVIEHALTQWYVPAFSPKNKV